MLEIEHFREPLITKRVFGLKSKKAKKGKASRSEQNFSLSNLQQIKIAPRVSRPLQKGTSAHKILNWVSRPFSF